MTAVQTKLHTEYPVHYKTARINDQDIFYREAGPQSAPVILLLHGFPTSSHMFRNLIPRLAGNFRLIAPDYPGYGQSSMPDHKSFEYSFENLGLALVDGLVEFLRLSRIFDVCDGLRGAGGLSFSALAPGTRLEGFGGAEWQRLRGRPPRILGVRSRSIGPSQRRRIEPLSTF